MTTRKPRGTGYCHGCGRRTLLSTTGKLFLHSNNPKEPIAYRVRCHGSMTRLYEPGPDQTYGSDV